MPTAEVMKRFNAYGLNVKAAASAVDEVDADRALTGKPPRKEENGAGPAQQRRPQVQTTGMGFDRPASKAAQEARERRIAEERARRAAEQRAPQASDGAGNGAQTERGTARPDGPQ